MNKQLTQLKALSAEEWQVLLTSMALLPLIALALRWKGYKWTRAFLQQRIPQGKNLPPVDELSTAQSVARIVSITAKHGPYQANCLKRSLVTWWLLQRRGIAAELNIGVNTDATDFNAHAWIEINGNALMEADDVREQFSTFGPH